MVALAAPGASLAQPPTLSEAKKAGFPAKNCQYCHTVALPKKETFKPDTDLNDRGKFLLADMEPAPRCSGALHADYQAT